MATYIAARSNEAPQNQVFGSDALVISTDTSGISDVVAVASTLTVANAIAAALNGA